MLPAMRRPVVLLLYMALFVGEVMWSAIVPLVPAFSNRFHLSTFEAGLLLASTSLAILLVSIPAGIVVDRIGARRLTIAAVVSPTIARPSQWYSPSERT